MSVADQWREVLKEGGYEHSARNREELDRVRKFSRTWKRVFRRIDLSAEGKGCRVFEFGCGGAKHLATFALNGWTCVGIDGSEDVLERARKYLAQLAECAGCKTSIKLVHGDFLEYELLDQRGQFDLVYQVGVLEHFLEENERMAAAKKMFDLTRPGGYVVSIVPNGAHPLRRRVQEEGLGGYRIPEINYTCSLLRDELEHCGGESIEIMPHNLFNYIFLTRPARIPAFVYRFYYYAWQIVPVCLLPKSFSCRHAEVLIGIARKPETRRQ